MKCGYKKMKKMEGMKKMPKMKPTILKVKPLQKKDNK